MGTCFVFEIGEPRGKERFLELINQRLYNYPIVKEIPEGYFFSSIDGDGLHIDDGQGWDALVYGCFTLRQATEKEIVAEVNLDL